MAGSVNPGRKSTTAPEDKNFWATQWECFADAVALYGRRFRFDVAAEPQTAKVPQFYSPVNDEDALKLDWPADWWCNPPFDLKVEFIRRARQQATAGRPGMLLLPYEPLTQWWQDNLSDDVVVYEPDGRYNFLERDGVTVKKGVNFGCALVLVGGFRIGPSIRITYKRGTGAHLTDSLRPAAPAITTPEYEDELI